MKRQALPFFSAYHVRINTDFFNTIRTKQTFAVNARLFKVFVIGQSRERRTLFGSYQAGLKAIHDLLWFMRPMPFIDEHLSEANSRW